MFALILAAMGTPAGIAPPAVSAVSATTGSTGECRTTSPFGVLTNAEVLITWTMTNPNAALYDTKVYEDDVLKTTLSNAVTEYSRTVNGNVEDGVYDSWASNWTFRVDVVRKSDGQVVSSSSASPWVQGYGRCRLPGDPL